MLFLFVACTLAPSDPRPGLADHLPVSQEPTPGLEAIRRALRKEQLPVACHLAKLRAAREPAEDGWLLLLTAAARQEGCLQPEDGDALATWAATLPQGAGPSAEWRAARGEDVAPAGDERSKLRIALRRGDGDAARLAAEGALLEDPGEIAACRIVANAALDERDLAWAVEVAACGGDGDTPELLRLRASALDRAGQSDDALALYERAGANVHRAAILYQDHPDRVEEARTLLEGPGPAALHRTWLALCHGAPPPIDGLDQSFQATVARALAAKDAPPDALADAAGAPAAVVRARLAAERRDLSTMERELDTALRDVPASDPIHRARIALRLSTGGDVEQALADWAALDPDHVAMTGTRGDRDLPWCGIVPETWAWIHTRIDDPRASAEAPRGSSPIGEKIRAARALPTAGARADAFGALDAATPGLDALPAERYRLGPPPVPKGPDPTP